MNGRSAAELAIHTRQSVLTLSATTVIRAVGDRNPKLPVLTLCGSSDALGMTALNSL
jgi:hypothetical protein